MRSKSVSVQPVQPAQPVQTVQDVHSVHRCWGAVAGEELPRESRLARATTIAARAGGQVSVFLTVFKIKSALTVITTVVTTLINRSLAKPKTQFAADASHLSEKPPGFASNGLPLLHRLSFARPSETKLSELEEPKIHTSALKTFGQIQISLRPWSCQLCKKKKSRYKLGSVNWLMIGLKDLPM